MKISKKVVFVVASIIFTCTAIAGVFAYSHNIPPAGICAPQYLMFEATQPSVEVEVADADMVVMSKETVEIADVAEVKHVATVESAEQEVSAEPSAKDGGVSSAGVSATINSDAAETSSSDQSVSGNTNTFDIFVGRFKIPSVGLSVACYSSSSQDTVDAVDSAAYYYGYGHTIIADHKHQGFQSIKSCRVGAKATLTTGSGTVEYTCIDIIQGHNTGEVLTDSNYNSIADLHPGALACYTCNDNWRNVTIVFFAQGGGADSTASGGENLGGSNTSYGPCTVHSWSEWEIAWEVNDESGHYGWEKRICSVCDEEEWVALTFEGNSEKSSAEPDSGEGSPVGEGISGDADPEKETAPGGESSVEEIAPGEGNSAGEGVSDDENSADEGVFEDESPANDEGPAEEGIAAPFEPNIPDGEDLPGD